MAGETEKTKGIALRIRPWSRTSHVVTWLTAEHGIVTTLVKGAVRPKSAFLGQYDLFYTCDLLYYARAGAGGMHPLREASPLQMRDGLRGRWRETSLAGYACGIAAELVPSGPRADDWFRFIAGFLDALDGGAAASPAMVIRLETAVLRMAGLAPDFSDIDTSAEWTPFSIDRGRAGTGARTIRITPAVAACLSGAKRAAAADDEVQSDALRFLGLFLGWHLDLPSETRRSVLQMLRRPPSDMAGAHSQNARMR